MIIVCCDNYGDCIEGSETTRQQPVGDRIEEERRDFLNAFGWHEEDDFGDGKGARHLCPFCHAKESSSIEPLTKLRAAFEGKALERYGVLYEMCKRRRPEPEGNRGQ